MNTVEEFAISQLEHLGCTVERVSRSDKETPDLYATDGDNSYLVEVKSKSESEAELMERQRTFEAKNIHYITKRLRRRNSISGVVRKAAGQLRCSSPDVLRLVWFQAVGFNEEPLFYQILYGLCGQAELLEVNVDDPVYKPCYFFGDSDFYRFRDRIDGAIVGKSDSGRLCINPLSKQVDRLRASQLVQKMQPGVTDPIEEEACGATYIADCDIPRDDVGAVLKYVQNKYHTPYLSVWPQHYFGAWVQTEA